MADKDSVFLDSPTKGCLYPNGYSGRGLAECGGNFLWKLKQGDVL